MATAKKAPAKKAPATSKQAAPTAPAKKAAKHSAPVAVPAKKAAKSSHSAKAAVATPVAKAPAKKAPAAKAMPAKAAVKAPAKKAPAAKATAPKAIPTKQPAAKAPAAKQPAVKAAAKKATASEAVAPKAAPTKAAPTKAAPTKAAAPSAPAAAAPVKAAAPKAAAKKPGPVVLEKAAVKGVTKEGVSYTKDFDAKFLTAQRALLLEEKVSLLGQAVRLEDEALSLITEQEMGDVQFDDEGGEGDTMVVERERDLALSAQARQTIADIEAALARLTVGTYGYSVESGRPIPRERLEAIPWATVLVEEKIGGIGRR